MDSNENQIPGYSVAIVPVRSPLLVAAAEFTAQLLPFIHSSSAENRLTAIVM